MNVSLGGIPFDAPGENQIEWIDRLLWHPVGQTIRYALAGNVCIQENPRSGRPVTLSAELPWSWLTSVTVEALHLVASTSSILLFVYGNVTLNVRFRRDQGPLDLTPIDPRKEYYTGTLYLIVV